LAPRHKTPLENKEDNNLEITKNEKRVKGFWEKQDKKVNTFIGTSQKCMPKKNF
jgi:hypothetical protein